MWNQTQQFFYDVYEKISILCIKVCLFCVWQFFYVLYDIFWLIFFSILFMKLSLTSTFYIYYIINFIFFTKKQKISPNWCVWSCWSSHTSWIKNRSRNTALEHYSKEDGFLIYCPLYMNHLEEYTKTPWPQGLITESVTEYKVWGF